MSEPGSSTAMGGTRVHSGASTSPRSARAEGGGRRGEGSEEGQQRPDEEGPAAEQDEPGDDPADDGGEDDGGPRGGKHQRDADRHEEGPERHPVGGVTVRALAQDGQPLEGLGGREGPGRQRGVHCRHLGELVQPHAAVDRLEGGRLTARERHPQARRRGGDLDAVMARGRGGLPHVLLDLVHRHASPRAARSPSRRAGVESAGPRPAGAGSGASARRRSSHPVRDRSSALP
uniref:Uncharacterized protein n=1 Tax=Janibacter limosus TaxID=53458 RepID=A0AC61U3B9_9MICO|nr:hypothetical protein [Janibacter limosus]